MPNTTRATPDVVAIARTRLGTPYVWGAAGPNAFDCSGLIVWTFAQAGISVPRTSQAQANAGQPVDYDQLQPGDVVTFYPDASHVGLYTGFGRIIHASTPGRPVAEVPIAHGGPFHNARRYTRKATTMASTLFADVSEFQVPVDDTYPHPVLSIRVCDGTYQDHKFSQNYAWMRDALDIGRLVFGIVYTYVRPHTWASNLTTVKTMIDDNGGLHDRVALMLDVESGGNPGGNQSSAINALFDGLADYAGDRARVIGYGNTSDLNTMWPTRPPGVRLIIACYGSNPAYPGKVAHQYTDGNGYGGGLPEGAPPFGHCDMNSADNLTPQQFAAVCGIRTDDPTPPTPTPGGPLMALTDDEQNELLAAAREARDNTRWIKAQLGPNIWGPDSSMGVNAGGQELTLRDGLAAHIRSAQEKTA